MPPSERSQLRREARRLWASQPVNCCAQLRLWTRDGDAPPRPADFVGPVVGGLYDPVLRRYVGGADPHQISAHRGQVDLVLAALRATHRHVVALGAPGGGKTFGAVSAAYMLAMVNANQCIGVVAPTDKRLKIVWRDFLRLAQSFGTVAEINKKDGFIVLANNCVAQFVSGQTGDKQRGSSAQGWTWSAAGIDEAQSVGDETMQEVEFRGRAVGDRYVIVETCTNSSHPVFRARLEAYKADPATNLIIRYRGEENVFVPLSNWQAIRRSALISERDYRTRFLLEDLPPEHVLYPTFRYAEHIRPMPTDWTDITAQFAEEKCGYERVDTIVGQDFGVLRTVSILLRCFRHPQTGRRVWWAFDELTSMEGVPTGYHAAQLARMVDPSRCLVVADPHNNKPGGHGGTADYSEMRAEGFRVTPAGLPPIPVGARVAMVNGLLKSARGETRLYLASDEQGRPRPRRLSESLLSEEVPTSGNLRDVRKDTGDLTHWTAALGYGLWLWEAPELVYGLRDAA